MVLQAVRTARLNDEDSDATHPIFSPVVVKEGISETPANGTDSEALLDSLMSGPLHHPSAYSYDPSLNLFYLNVDQAHVLQTPHHPPSQQSSTTFVLTPVATDAVPTMGPDLTISTSYVGQPHPPPPPPPPSNNIERAENNENLLPITTDSLPPPPPPPPSNTEMPQNVDPISTTAVSEPLADQPLPPPPPPLIPSNDFRRTQNAGVAPPATNTPGVCVSPAERVKVLLGGGGRGKKKGDGGREKVQGVFDGASVVKKVKREPAAEKVGTWGVTKLEFEAIQALMRHAVEVINECQNYRSVLNGTDTEALITIIRHFEYFTKTIVLYRMADENVKVFSPPPIINNPRLAYCQPLIVCGTAVLIVSFPNRTNALVADDTGSVSMRSGAKAGHSERCHSVFIYHNDVAIKRAVFRALQSHDDFKDVPELDFFSFTSDCKNRAIASFVFVLYTFNLFIEGKYTIDLAKKSLERTKFDSMKEQIIARLASYASQKWSTSKGKRKTAPVEDTNGKWLNCAKRAALSKKV